MKSFIFKTKYRNPDGTMMLHIVDECPRDYHVGFLVKKGWPFRNKFNRILLILFEAGKADNRETCFLF